MYNGQHLDPDRNFLTFLNVLLSYCVNSICSLFELFERKFFHYKHVNLLFGIDCRRWN